MKNEVFSWALCPFYQGGFWVFGEGEDVPSFIKNCSPSHRFFSSYEEAKQDAVNGVEIKDGDSFYSWKN